MFTLVPSDTVVSMVHKYMVCGTDSGFLREMGEKTQKTKTKQHGGAIAEHK